MVMEVTSPPLQAWIDQWDHMSRFGINVPKYFLVHDDVSLVDLFREWVTENDLDKIKMYRFERDSDEGKINLAASVDTLSRDLTQEHVKDYYHLALPYIDENEFVMSGWVKSPPIDNPFNLQFGYREDHRIPYEDDEEFPCKLLEFDHRGSVPHSSQYFGDIRRIACGFPYQACRMTWSVTSSRVGRDKQHLMFWDYQVDEEYIRD